MKASTVLYSALTISLGCMLIFFEDSLPQPISAALASCALLSLTLAAIFHFLARRGSPVVYLFAFTAIFYAAGLTPITSRRDYIDIGFWSTLLVIALVFLSLGAWTAKALSMHSAIERVSSRPIDRLRLLAIYAGSMMAAAYILMTAGLVILNPESRFYISSTWIYLVEFSIAATVSLCAATLTQGRSLSRSILLLAMAQSIALLGIGYRNQLVLLWLGVGFVALFTRRPNVITQSIFLRAAITSFLGLVALSALLYLRIQFSTESILSWEVRVREFNIVLADYMLPLLTVHDASRETMGVAQIALERVNEVEQTTTRWGFFFMDLLTILPGHSDTATGLLGRIVGNSEEMYLVPGLIGALQVAFGLAGVPAFYFILGFLVSKLWISFNRTNDPRTLAVLVLVLIYSIQLTYRGIPKPMYITAVIVALLLFKGRSKPHSVSSPEQATA